MRLVTTQGLAGALAVAGCNGPGRSPASVTRDSAGIAIVESSAPADGTRPRYAVDSAPAVEIRSAGNAGRGLGTGPIPTELSDGRIVVADPGGSVIHFFGARGQELKSFGRKGQGPGEFESIASIARFAGDSLVAFDILLRRYSVFDDTGAFVRSGLLGAGITMPIPVGGFGDGTLLIRDGFPLRPSGIAGPALFSGGQTGEQQAPTPLFRAPLNGSPVDSIGAVAGSEVLLEASGGAMSIMPIHFGRTGVVTARDSVIVSGDGAGFDFAIRHQDGRIVGRFRRPATADPVTSAELDALIASQLADLPTGSRADMERRLRETPHRSTRPLYDRIVISDAGESWIRHFVTSALEDRRSMWSVFSGRGEWLCDVTMPAAFLPHAITRDHLLGTWIDESGDVFIQVRGLQTTH
jgi:hypothetical protein